LTGNVLFPRNEQWKKITLSASETGFLPLPDRCAGRFREW